MEIKRGYERMPGRRGRGFDRAFLPMDFVSFLEASGLSTPVYNLFEIIGDEKAFSEFHFECILNKDKIQRCLEVYLRKGGFPRAVRDVLSNGELEEETFEIYKSVIFSEFEKQRRSPALLMGLLRRLYESVGTPVSYASLSQDTALSNVRAVQDYLEILGAAFLGFTLPCVDLNRRLAYPKRPREFFAIDPIIWNVVRKSSGLSPLQTAFLAEQAVAIHLMRLQADRWASLGSPEGLYYWQSKKGKEVDFVFYVPATQRPFGVEVKYQGRVSGWDEMSIKKGIGQGVLVTRDTFKWGDVYQIPLWAFLLLSFRHDTFPL